MHEAHLNSKHVMVLANYPFLRDVTMLAVGHKQLAVPKPDKALPQASHTTATHCSGHARSHCSQKTYLEHWQRGLNNMMPKAAHRAAEGTQL
jgi:hypothetical protein